MNKYTYRNYKKENLKKRKKRFNPYHLVKPSPWPILTALGAFGTVLGAALTMHFYSYGKTILVTSFIFLLFILSLWWRDVIREATFENAHTVRVQRGLRIGFALLLFQK